MSWRVHRYEEVSSTNDVAAQFAERGAEEGCVVVADAQSAGRGRHGRAWSSPVGAGLYVSVVLRPRAAITGLLTIAAGVAIAEGIQAASGLDASVKWPNDVYAGGRKLAGILAEAGSSPGGAPHVVLGFGINVRPMTFPPDLALRATSIESELGRSIDRHLLLASCLAALANRYADLHDGRAGAVLDAWRLRAATTFRRRVEWDRGEIRARGVAENIDEDGALLVRVGDDVVRVISGEVRWL
ncbi:MAG TPA: biotin--[acetyl-CoA-carboxylase] ligase [Vicinamibacterales bacterium]